MNLGTQDDIAQHGHSHLDVNDRNHQEGPKTACPIPCLRGLGRQQILVLPGRYLGPTPNLHRKEKAKLKLLYHCCLS